MTNNTADPCLVILSNRILSKKKEMFTQTKSNDEINQTSHKLTEEIDDYICHKDIRCVGA